MSLPGDAWVVDLVSKGLLAIVGGLVTLCAYYMKGLAADVKELQQQHNHTVQRVVRLETVQGITEPL